MRSASPFVRAAGFYAWAVWIALLLLGATQTAHLETCTPDAEFAYSWALQRTAAGAPFAVILDRPSVRRGLPGLTAPVSAKRRGLDGRAALMGWIALASLAVGLVAAVPTAAAERLLDPSPVRRVRWIRAAGIAVWLVPTALAAARDPLPSFADGLAALGIAAAVAALGAVPSSRAIVVRTVTGIAAAGFVTALVLDAAGRPPRGSAEDGMHRLRARTAHALDNRSGRDYRRRRYRAAVGSSTSRGPVALPPGGPARLGAGRPDAHRARG